MDYNKSLDELVKRDKKLGKMQRGGPKPGQKRQQNTGKQPNRMQQQRNMVSANKQQNPRNKTQGKGPKLQQQPQRLKNRGAAIYKNKNAARQPQNQQATGKNVRTAQGHQGRVMRPNANQQKGSTNTKQVVSTRRRQLLRQKQQPNKPQVKQRPQTKTQSPKQQQQSKPQMQKQAAPLVIPQGTLEQRKLKVRNIDANTVTVTDLQKLFSKCGALITASFDKNMHGQYLGSATLIYQKANSAASAIKQFNGAQLDDRVMKVEYGLAESTTKPRVPMPASTSGIQNKNNRARQQNATKQPIAPRRGNNAIQKNRSGQQQQQQKQKSQQQPQRGGSGANRRGKTLRVSPAGNKQQQQQKQQRRPRK